MQAASSGRIEEIRAKIAVLDPSIAEQAPKPRTAGSDPTATDTKPATTPKEGKGS